MGIGAYCRFCLQNLNVIIKVNIFEEQNNHVIQKISNCLSITVSKDDKLPKSLCRVCFQKLEEFQTFKDMCHKAETLIQTFLSFAEIQGISKEMCKPPWQRITTEGSRRTKPKAKEGSNCITENSCSELAVRRVNGISEKKLSQKAVDMSRKDEFHARCSTVVETSLTETPYVNNTSNLENSLHTEIHGLELGTQTQEEIRSSFPTCQPSYEKVVPNSINKTNVPSIRENDTENRNQKDEGNIVVHQVQCTQEYGIKSQGNNSCVTSPLKDQIKLNFSPANIEEPNLEAVPHKDDWSSCNTKVLVSRGVFGNLSDIKGAKHYPEFNDSAYDNTNSCERSTSCSDSFETSLSELSIHKQNSASKETHSHTCELGNRVVDSTNGSDTDGIVRDLQPNTDNGAESGGGSYIDRTDSHNTVFDSTTGSGNKNTVCDVQPSNDIIETGGENLVRVDNSVDGVVSLLREEEAVVQNDGLVKANWLNDQDRISKDALRNVNEATTTKRNSTRQSRRLKSNECMTEIGRMKDVYEGSINASLSVGENTSQHLSVISSGEFAIRNEIERRKAYVRLSVLYMCDTCDKIFTQKSLFDIHLKAHDCDDGGCSDSNKVLSKSIACDKSAETKSKVFICKVCSKCFSDGSSMKRHLRIIHYGQRPFSCLKCRKSFGRKHHLTQHIRIHSGQKPFRCRQCNKCFRQKSALNYHLLSHSGRKPFQCSTCNKRVSSKGSLAEHVRQHFGIKPYFCVTCSSAFSYSACYRKHLKRKHDETNVCNQRERK